VAPEQDRQTQARRAQRLRSSPRWSGSTSSAENAGLAGLEPAPARHASPGSRVEWDCGGATLRLTRPPPEGLPARKLAESEPLWRWSKTGDRARRAKSPVRAPDGMSRHHRQRTRDGRGSNPRGEAQTGGKGRCTISVPSRAPVGPSITTKSASSPKARRRLLTPAPAQVRRPGASLPLRCSRMVEPPPGVSSPGSENGRATRPTSPPPVPASAPRSP
jgi:hypothetical protein